MKSILCYSLLSARLEPLLYEIQTDRRTLATGHLDWIQKSGTDIIFTHDLFIITISMDK